MVKRLSGHLVFLVVVVLVVTMGVTNANLGVDLVVTLDVGLAGEVGPPLGLSVVLAAGLVLAVGQKLSVAVTTIAVALALTLGSPVNVVVRDVGPVDGLLSVAVLGSGDGNKSQKNDGNLYHGINK